MKTSRQDVFVCIKKLSPSHMLLLQASTPPQEALPLVVLNKLISNSIKVCALQVQPVSVKAIPQCNGRLGHILPAVWICIHSSSKRFDTTGKYIQKVVDVNSGITYINAE